MTTAGTDPASDGRRSFPDVIPHQPPASAGPDDPIPFATDRAGQPAVFATAGTHRPHMIVTGVTGAGLTATCRVVALEAARRGIAVRACCSRPGDAEALGCWPGITAVSSAQGMSGLINSTRDDMMSRYLEIGSGRAQPGDVPRTLLVIDELATCAMIASAWQAGQRAELIGTIHSLLAGAAGACINLVVAVRLNPVLAVHGPGPAGPPAGIRGSFFGTHVVLGRQASAGSATLIPGPASVPCSSRGEGIMVGPDGPASVKVHWLPDPGGYPASLCSGDRALLRAMLPGGPGCVHVLDPPGTAGSESAFFWDPAAAGRPHAGQ
jgi:hypothetical protein